MLFDFTKAGRNGIWGIFSHFLGSHSKAQFYREFIEFNSKTVKLGTTAPSETFTVYIIKTFLRITSTCSVKMKMFSDSEY